MVISSFYDLVISDFLMVVCNEQLHLGSYLWHSATYCWFYVVISHFLRVICGDQLCWDSYVVISCIVMVTSDDQPLCEGYVS